MKRIDGPGHVGNLFTEGTPPSVPATDVKSDWLNALQEELATFIESRGITLDQTGANKTQLRQALENLLGFGNQLDFTIADNAGVTDLTGLLFSKATVKAVRMFFQVNRKTDAPAASLNEAGEIYIWHDAVSDTWEVSFDSKGNDSGLTFTITAAGQLEYSSSNMNGTGYLGKMRVTDIKQIKQVA